MSDQILVAFAGGGTGGHLYPALAVVEWLRQHHPGVRFHFWCTQRPIDADILSRAGITFSTQPIQPLRLEPSGLLRFYRTWRTSKAMCRESFRRDRPAVVVGTGGYGSGPAVRTAQRLGIATALLNPDAIPGKANRYLASGVDAVFVQWPESSRYFRSRVNVVATGCPIREGFCRSAPLAGHAAFGLDPARKTLLVTGASSGARTINDALCEIASDLAQLVDWQVLHISGSDDQERMVLVYAQAGVSAQVVAYTHEMPAALRIAGLALARSGAVTLAELTATATPAALMPYPYHGDQHQTANARMLTARGQAIMVPDAMDPQINAALLRRVLLPLMSNPERLAVMRAAARAAVGPNPTQAVAEQVLSLAGRTSGG